MKSFTRHPHLAFAVIVAVLWVALTLDWATVIASTSAALSRFHGAPPAAGQPAPAIAAQAAQSGLMMRHSAHMIQGSDGSAYGLAMVVEGQQDGGGGFLPTPTNGDVPNGAGGLGAGRGGNGGRCYPCGGGGGGGAGVGGGLFVWSEFFLPNSQTNVNLVNCSFTGNTVQGGTGGQGGNGAENGGNGYGRGADAYFMESETLSECSTNFGNAYFEHNFFINHLPFPNTSISGPSLVCTNTAYPSSTPDAGAGATYQWAIVNGTITGGQNARVVTFRTGTSPSITLSVAVRTATGCGSASRDVSVLSPVPPVLTCQDLLYAADLGTNGAVVNYPIPIAADFCGGVTIVCNPPPGSFFPIGKLNGPNFGLGGPTPVTCTAVDLQGTSRSCTFRIGVDHIQPQFTARPTEITVNAALNSCQALIDLSQYFQATGAPQPAVKYKYDPRPGQPTFESTAANPTAFPIGTTTLYVFATNSVTLANGPHVFTVTVRETTPPTISCPANSTSSSCSTVVNYVVTATDTNCPNVNIVSEPPSGSTFPVGTLRSRQRQVTRRAIKPPATSR